MFGRAFFNRIGKIYTKAHGSKTQNLAINFDHEASWYLDADTPLYMQGIRNETELSYFNKVCNCANHDRLSMMHSNQIPLLVGSVSKVLRVLRKYLMFS
jgi:hypothetical protein